MDNDQGIKSFLEDELGLTIARVTKSGEYIAYCPLHEDNDASLFVNPHKGKFHCFSGCLRGSGGLKGLFEALQPKTDLNSRFMMLFLLLCRVIISRHAIYQKRLYETFLSGITRVSMQLWFLYI